MKSSLFWVATQRILIVVHRRFGTASRSHLQAYGTEILPRNIGEQLPTNVVDNLEERRPCFSYFAFSTYSSLVFFLAGVPKEYRYTALDCKYSWFLIQSPMAALALFFPKCSKIYKWMSTSIFCQLISFYVEASIEVVPCRVQPFSQTRLFSPAKASEA